jgi:hypothetical protein
MTLSNLRAAAQGRRRRTPITPVLTGNVETFTLTSATGGSNLPFSGAVVFKRGDVAAASVAGLGGNTAVQITPKNYWVDGSLKLALIAGRKTLSAGVPGTLTIQRAGTVTGGAALTTTDLKATGITASIAFGSFGTVSWATTDWDTPVETWVSGPEMSSWKYRKAIGSDTHLVGWLEVRLYVGGQVQCIAWIENGYINVASPTSKAGTATFTLGGSSRYSASLTLLHHQRAVLGSASTLTHWLGSSQDLTLKMDTAYMMATKLVPNYTATTAAGSAWWTAGNQSGNGSPPCATTYAPLDQAQYETDMSGVGYGAMLGLLPQWCAAYFTSGGDERALKASIINAYCLGRYGIHYRDENTNRPMLTASYANLVVRQDQGINHSGQSGTSTYTPVAGGTTPPLWDMQHHPAPSYLPYLLTGWNYFLEEMLFVASANYMTISTAARQTSKGILLSEAGQVVTRGYGWASRSLAMAVCCIPDSDTAMKADYQGMLNENIQYYWNRYVNSPGNPLGFVQPYDHYNTAGATGTDPWTHSCFMYDYIVQSWGFLKDLACEDGAYTSKLTDFCLFQYKFVVGTFGANTSGEFNFTYARNFYAVYIAPTQPDDGNAGRNFPSLNNYFNNQGPWYSTWGDVATAMSVPTGGNTLQGASAGDPGVMPTGYWGYCQPALAYAVDHGAPGAAAGWARLVGATNYAVNAAKFADAGQESAIAPR